ncbi:ADP-ribosyltransferase [Nocardia sp. alder85J]|uniref:ADP-ribosyltransferase n=1 Tax=Nocardia sp. alder85J TaxID=2862949 RepID=UPI001CD1D04D|nr:ADP-ribosyltransferase [Nocardia sp. alder85J]MCX4093045.1 hypothetical protein [Nocardia sp. alder85J]
MDWLDTGGAMRPRDPGYDDAWAADAYDHFRADPTDVDAIADHLAAVRRPDGSIGYSRDEVAQVKSHLMSEEHLLRDYDNGGYTRARFDPSADQAEAWIRLREGRPLPQDLVMLEHELAESNYMRDHPDATYPEAHRHANQRYNWERDIPERTGEHYDSAGKDDHGSTGVLRPDPGGHDPGGVPVRDGRAEPGSQPGDRQEDSGIPGHRQTGGRDTAGDGGPDPASGPHGGELAEGRNHPVVEPVWNRAQAHDPRLLNEMRARVARGGHPGLEHILDRLTGNPAKGIPATPHDPDLWAEAYGEYQLGPARDQLSPHEFEAAHKYTVQSLVNSYLRDPQYDDARIDWFLKWMSYDFQGVEAVGIVTDSGPPRYRSVTELRRFAVDLWNSDRSHPLHSYLKTVLQNPDGSLKNDSSERWNEALGRHSQYSSFAYQLSGDMSASGWRNHMDLFDHAVDQPIDENIRVLRGLHDMSFLTAQDGMPLGGRDPALLKNQQQVEHGYMSTAVGESLAVIDKNPFRYRVELDVPKGSRGLWMGPRSAYGGQREVILPRNTHYVIEDVVPMADGSYLVRARVLTPQELGAPDTASG